MAGIINFVASFFENSENTETERVESEHFTESEMENENTETEENLRDLQVEQSQEWSEEKMICKFFLEGRCRFGERCKNIHIQSQQHESIKQQNRPQSGHKKPQNKEDKLNKKLPSMRTASDVINRIKWDEMLPEEFFVVGYIDRFLGVKEESFGTFVWEDLASVDYDVLAIPQHRIQYFKYKTEKVWDKNERLDIVFGSTENNEGLNIIEFMEQVDREVEGKRREELEDYDYDSDDEEIGDNRLCSVTGARQ